jgi:small subunit ribosomal protein S17
VRERGQRNSRTGVVVSDRMDKTVVVEIAGQRRHPMYGKTVRWTSKLTAHDEGNEAKIGDRVRIVENRPISKTKRWRLTEIVERAQ